MKQILIVLVCISLCQCKKDTGAPSPTKGAINWIVGSWERTNETEGKQTFEIWEQLSTETYMGMGYTLKDRDTIFKEHMRLFKKDTLWTLEVLGVHEAAMPFVVTHLSPNNFVAENPENDFPKGIKYSYFDDTITATIWNEEMEIPFIFWRMEN